MLNQIFSEAVVENCLLGLVVFLISFMLLRLIEKYLIRKLRKVFQKTGTRLDDILLDSLAGVFWPLYIVLPTLMAAQFVALPHFIVNLISPITMILIVYYLVIVLQKFVVYGLLFVLKHKKEANGGELDDSAATILQQIIKIILWLIAVMFVMQNLGYNISTILGGMGIIGIGVGFSLRNVLGDFFSFFSIYFGKPFRVGDFVVVSDSAGTVKKISIKSTHLKSLTGSELIIPNKVMVENKLVNYRAMEKRRVSFSFSVDYETPAEKLAKIPEAIKRIVERVKLVKSGSVHLRGFGDYGFKFGIIYHMDTSNYSDYMNVHQEITLGIKKLLEKEKIEMAYAGQAYK